MKLWSLGITTILFLGSVLTLCLMAEPFVAGLFFVPFSLGPMFLSLLMMGFSVERKALAWLLASSVAYFAWFAFAYISIFYLWPDPQSPIGFLFVGVYSVPVMLGFWITALVIELKGRNRRTTSGSSNAD